MTSVASLSEADLFAAMMTSQADSIFFKDRDCRLVRVSAKMVADLGFPDASALIGKTDSEIFGAEFGAQTRLDDLRVMEDDHPIIGLIEGRALPDGRTNWTITSKLPLHDADGEVIGLYGVTREINEIRQTEAALQHLATHDSLTDLPNRFLLTDRMNQLLVRSSRRPVSFAILFMDIDRFKVVNDTFGHETGDQLLRVVADRLRLAVRTSDTVARLGGDEFVVLIETPAAEAAAERVARKIEAAFVLPFTLARQRIKVGISIGISLHPQSGDSADALMHAADRAMYMAKREGGNRHRTCLPEEPCSNADFVEASA